MFHFKYLHILFGKAKYDMTEHTKSDVKVAFRSVQYVRIKTILMRENNVVVFLNSRP